MFRFTLLLLSLSAPLGHALELPPPPTLHEQPHEELGSLTRIFVCTGPNPFAVPGSSNTVEVFVTALSRRTASTALITIESHPWPSSKVILPATVTREDQGLWILYSLKLNEQSRIELRLPLGKAKDGLWPSQRTYPAYAYEEKTSLPINYKCEIDPELRTAELKAQGSI